MNLFSNNYIFKTFKDFKLEKRYESFLTLTTKPNLLYSSLYRFYQILAVKDDMNFDYEMVSLENKIITIE